jgi:hypothetical protein
MVPDIKMHPRLALVVGGLCLLAIGGKRGSCS